MTCSATMSAVIVSIWYSPRFPMLPVELIVVFVDETVMCRPTMGSAVTIAFAGERFLRDRRTIWRCRANLREDAA